MKGRLLCPRERFRWVFGSLWRMKATPVGDVSVIVVL